MSTPYTPLGVFRLYRLSRHAMQEAEKVGGTYLPSFSFSVLSPFPSLIVTRPRSS